MVDEVSVEEAVYSLVGGQPETVPAVDEHRFDEVEAAGQLRHAGSVIAEETVRISNKERAVVCRTHKETIVGLPFVEGRQEPYTVVFDAVDTVLCKSVKGVALAAEGEEITLCASQGDGRFSIG